MIELILGGSLIYLMGMMVGICIERKDKNCLTIIQDDNHYYIGHKFVDCKCQKCGLIVSKNIIEKIRENN